MDYELDSDDPGELINYMGHDLFVRAGDIMSTITAVIYVAPRPLTKNGMEFLRKALPWLEFVIAQTRETDEFEDLRVRARRLRTEVIECLDREAKS